MIKKIVMIMDKKERLEGVGVLVVLAVGALLELLGVSSILPLVDLIVDPQRIENYKGLVRIAGIFSLSQYQLLAVVALILIVIYIVKNIFVALMYRIQFLFTYKNQYNLAKEIFHKYIHQDYLYHTNKNVAEIQRDLDKDVFNFYAVVLACIQLCEEALVMVLLIVYLAKTDWITTLVVAGIAMIFLMTTTVVAKKKLNECGNNVRNYIAESSKWVLQAFAGIKEVKVTNAEGFFEKEYRDNYWGFAENQRRAKYYEILPKPVMETACMMALLLPLTIRLFSGYSGDGFISTMSVFAVAAIRLLPCFNRMSSYLNTISENKGTIESIEKCKKLHIKDCDEILDDKKKQFDFKESIKINKAYFTYPGSSDEVLSNVNLEIKKNTTIGFIGPSGAGKTTTVDLILGLMRVSKGDITLDDLSIYEIIEQWHSIVSYIPQNIYLMDDSIRNNIIFGCSDEHDEEYIDQCLEDAQLIEFVNSLEDGVDTIIGDRGVRLSGGQRQRIGIARALYRDPQVIILDEATSALDNATERAVMDAVANLQGKMTILIVAHRLSTVEKCDFIYEVKDKKIKLIDKNGLFKE